MAEVVMNPNELCDIDVNQVSSMQLKDGTVVVVDSEAGAGDFTEEQLGDEYEAQTVEYTQDNLRARPMVGMPVGVRPGVPVRPAVVPVRPAVAPIRPAVVPAPGRPPVVVPKPMPRGPVVRPGVPMGGVVYRARPGMPVHMPPKMVVAPKPVVPVRPAVPVMKPVVPGPMMPKPMPLPVKPAVMPVRPGVPVVTKPMVVPGRPGVFRARPNYNEEEDFQEEYAGEEDYCECDDYEGTGEDQLRARPLVVPAPMTYAPGVVRPGPVHHPPVRPPVVAPPRVVPLPPKRGPAVVRPGLNTFQPGVFRARPRVVARPVAVPMFTPLAPGYGVGRVPRPMPPPPRPMGFGMGPVFRSRPNTSAYDAQEVEYAEENAEQYDTEGCDYNTSSVCTKCGKAF